MVRLTANQHEVLLRISQSADPWWGDAMSHASPAKSALSVSGYLDSGATQGHDAAMTTHRTASTVFTETQRMLAAGDLDALTEELAADAERQADALHNSNLHAVFATTPDHETVRVSDPLSWNSAQNEWSRLDDLRREGRFPQYKFFEVRTVTLGPDRPLVGPEVRSHDRYDRAPVVFVRPVVKSKGYTNKPAVARAAWRLFAPEFTDRGRVAKRLSRWSGDHSHVKVAQQGRGGWFYYPSGVTAAQGLDSLFDVCVRMNLVVQGGDGRWYVVDLSDTDARYDRAYHVYHATVSA